MWTLIQLPPSGQFIYLTSCFLFPAFCNFSKIENLRKKIFLVNKISVCFTNWRTNITPRIEQCCGSGMFIPDPGSRISDPGSKNRNKREGWKKNCCQTFLCSHKFHKNVNYFIFEVLKKKNWANFQRIIELLIKKIVAKLSKIWVWDPGSGIRDPGSGIRKKPIPDPGSRGQKGTGSRIPDSDPQHWNRGIKMSVAKRCAFVEYYTVYRSMHVRLKINTFFSGRILNFHFIFSTVMHCRKFILQNSDIYRR